MLIHWRTVIWISICLGIPLLIIGCEGDPAKAATPPAKCQITGVYVNHIVYADDTGVGWIGFWGAYKCKNHDASSVRATFQILRDNRQWRVLKTTTSPIQFNTKCRRGGKFVEFRGRLTVTVKDAKSSKTRQFVRNGMPHHWRCLPR